MARRPPSSDSNDSHKENEDVAAKFKDEKTKNGTVKEERRQSRRQKEAVEEPGVERERTTENDPEVVEGQEDSYVPGEDNEADAQGDVSPRSRKRPRVEGQEDSLDVKEEHLRIQAKTLPRDADGFIPGSIVRIQLRNFVTYDWVEFRPGPYLNMILGPNGTGKSSIACAICLGLNWPPSILGRASNINEFVKLGTDDGHIEIELKGKEGEQNLIIRRNIIRLNKSSTFTLNGQSTTGKEISARVAELNVQVGNLCSFLPQDKVSEFAQMSPQELLRETQRAAGDENLTAWHDTLINAGKELKDIRDLMKGDADQLKQMQARNDSLEKEVQLYKLRREIEHDIALLEILLPVQDYREAFERYKVMKKLQRDQHAKVTALAAKNKPAHDLSDRLEEQYKQLQKVRDEKKKAAQKKFKQMNDKWSGNEKLDEEVEKLSNELDNLKKSEKTRQKRIRDQEAKLAELHHQRDNPPEIEDKQALGEATKAALSDQRQLAVLQADLQRRQQVNVNETAKHNSIGEHSSKALARLNDENEQKWRALHKWDPDTADAVKWLRQNKNKFKMEVFEPAALILKLKDLKYVDAVESCFSAVQQKSFVAQCKEDYDTMNHWINDTESLGRKARITVWWRPNNEETLVPPPLNDDEMKQLGFDGYAISYVDCPEEMKWFLKSEIHLHRTAIGLNSSKIDVSRAMEVASRTFPNGTGGGANFIAGKTMNIVQRSRYGRKAAQNMTREIRQARNFVNAVADSGERSRLHDQIREAQQALVLLKEEEEQLNKEQKDFTENKGRVEGKLEELRKRRVNIEKAERARSGLQAKIEMVEKGLTGLRNAESIEDKEAALKKKLFDAAKKRIKLAKEYTALIRGAIADQAAASRTTFEFMQISANHSALQALCDQKDEQHQRALEEFNRVDKEYEKIKKECKEKLAASRNAMDTAEPDVYKDYQAVEAVREAWYKDDNNQGTPPPEVEARSADQLALALETKKHELQMNLSSNPGVVEQYERRKKEIEELEKALEGREKKGLRIERSIKTARDNWEPALQELINSVGNKFSAAFDRIGCAGEIKISEHEDYDKWAIDILVKFRDEEKLQLLTAQRQSGGERSLTTILYLMSLTEEARAPFSLVDEINQGMDQRAERAVHNSMVEVTCQKNSAQYFLITPKLLPDLEYHERMKVLCVNNGEWLPEETGLGNMMNMVEAFVQRRDRASTAA